MSVLPLAIIALIALLTEAVSEVRRCSGAISQPELISRGFAESDELLSEMRREAHEIVRDLLADDIREIKLLQEHIHDGIGQLVYDRTRRRPMILPVVIEV